MSSLFPFWLVGGVWRETSSVNTEYSCHTQRGLHEGAQLRGKWQKSENETKKFQKVPKRPKIY